MLFCCCCVTCCLSECVEIVRRRCQGNNNKATPQVSAIWNKTDEGKKSANPRPLKMIFTRYHERGHIGLQLYIVTSVAVGTRRGSNFCISPPLHPRNKKRALRTANNKDLMKARPPFLPAPKNSATFTPFPFPFLSSSLPTLFKNGFFPHLLRGYEHVPRKKRAACWEVSLRPPSKTTTLGSDIEP